MVCEICGERTDTLFRWLGMLVCRICYKRLKEEA